VSNPSTNYTNTSLRIMPYTSNSQRTSIVSLKAAGLTNREIAEKENVSPGTVSNIDRAWCKTGKIHSIKPKIGWPLKMSDEDVHKAVEMLSTCRAKNAADLQRLFFPHFSVDTVRKGLKKGGLHAYVRRSKPLLTRQHIRKRLDWAERHCYWDGEDWRAVIFSDESKFNLFGSDGREWCWRKPGEACDSRYMKKKLKHGGGNVMVWGCVTRYGVGELHRIEGIMDRFAYVKILQKSLLCTLDNHNLDRDTIYFQQDLDPKHNSNHAKGWFNLEGLDVLPWSPNSPDMNLIENLWDHLDQMVHARNPLLTNLDNLWLALKEEWGKIDQTFIDKLYDSMPNRVCDLMKAKGGATRY